MFKIVVTVETETTFRVDFISTELGVNVDGGFDGDTAVTDWTLAGWTMKELHALGTGLHTLKEKLEPADGAD